MLTRTGGLLTAVGGVLGAGVAVAVHFLTTTRPDVTYRGRYVPMQDLTTSKAYSSTLSITLDGVHPSWWPMLPLYVVGGLVVGLLAAVVLRRRVSGSSPTG